MSGVSREDMRKPDRALRYNCSRRCAGFVVTVQLFTPNRCGGGEWISRDFLRLQEERVRRSKGVCEVSG